MFTENIFYGIILINMKHPLSKHKRSVTLGIAFSSLAIVFAAQISALRSTAHGIYVQANAVEVRPPAMPGETTLRSAAPSETKKTRAQVRKEARTQAKAKREARRSARMQSKSSASSK